MHSQKAFWLACFLMLLSGWPEAFAQKIGEADYRYPYKDPYVATSTMALLKGREKIASGDIRDSEVKVLDNRDNVYLLEGMGKLRYRFYQQKELAPLVFIIPGIGSSAYIGSARYLAEFLAGHGFHVIILPSPFNWNFALAASRSGIPGLIEEDTKDLYTVMQIILNSVKEQWHAKIGKIGLLGLSEGARDTGYIANLDAAEKKIGINAYLMLNPQVELLYTMKQIDAMAEIGNSYRPKQRSYLEDYALGVLTDALKKDLDKPDYFMDWDNRIHLKDRQLQYLIGNELQKAVGDAIYASSLALTLDIMRTPISWGNRSSRFKEANSFTLRGYVENFLIPKIRQLSSKDMDIQKLNKLTSLNVVKTTLENNKTIYLMHNLDDFLISSQDLAYLENIFGARAKIYPHGGHLGNLWYEENQRDILSVFKPLLQEPAQPVK